MNYCGIYKCDSANGVGVRVSFYVSGCSHHCEGCFNSETWSFDYGKEYTSDTEKEILDALNKTYINGITILGGEPMELVNQNDVYKLILKIKEKMPDKTIWVYSGYLYEELTDKNNKRCHGVYTEQILDNIDILVDGEFVLSKKDLTLRFKGSSNQRVIDVRSTRRTGSIVLSEYN